MVHFCERTDRILTEIIGKAAPPVFQIGFRYITPVENIIHGFIQPGIPDGLLLVKPRPESLQNRFFLLETQLFPLFIITGILFVNGVFHGKQPIAVLNSLYCRLAVVILLPFGNSVDKVSADMCPTGAAPDPRRTPDFFEVRNRRTHAALKAWERMVASAAPETPI